LFLLCLSSSCVPHVTSDKDKPNKNNPEKLETWGTQDEDKQNKNNPEKLETWGTQDKDKQSKNNPEKLATWGTQDKDKQNKNNPENLCCQFLWIGFCFVCLCLVYPMLPVSLNCFCFVCLRLVYQRKNNPEKLATWGTQDEKKTKQKQSRETGKIGYTRQRQTKQKQSRETGNSVPYVASFSGLVFVLFVFILCTPCCQFL
jgi:hypothetical protein